jgi:hypothetical protein
VFYCIFTCNKYSAVELQTANNQFQRITRGMVLFIVDRWYVGLYSGGGPVEKIWTENAYGNLLVDVLYQKSFK